MNNKKLNEAKKCTKCKIKNREGYNKLCSSCRMKEWRKENPDKIKSYLERNKERIKRFAREYRLKNLEHIKKIKKEYERKVGYAYDKSGKRKEYASIRAKTRSKYPLKGKDCEICNNVQAQQRHHTTIPPEVDKFIFSCNDCHDDLHGRKRLVSGEESK